MKTILRTLALAALLLAAALWINVLAERSDRQRYEAAGLCQVDSAGEIVGRCELPEGS